MQLEIDIFGDKQFSRELLRFERRGTDMSPVFEVMADDFLRVETKQFQTQGRFASGGWKPLAPSTVARKARLHLDPRILHATLALRKSLTVRGAPGQVRHVSADELVVGTDVRSKRGYPYAKAHQLGRGVSRRRPIEFRETDRVAWVKALQQYLVTGVAAMRTTPR